jgi:hypothetical protein
MTPAAMAERYRRPDWVRRVNAMGAAVGGAERLVPLDADEILGQALASVGAQSASDADLGDPEWQDRFRSLVTAMDGAGVLTVVGRIMVRQELLRCLRTRLQVARYHAEHPDAGARPVVAPVIIAGPARSGTTILFELLAQSPGLRAPLAWEGLHPMPLAGDVDRAGVAECEQELWADVQPEFEAIHELRARLPVECVTLMAPAFAMGHWAMIGNFGTWIPDPVPAYRFHAALLRVLQHGGPPATWVLKTPMHLLCLPLVFATYPDAWVIQTHRDPAKTMPSSISTVAMIHWLRADTVDVASIAESLDAPFVAGLLETTRSRDAGELPDRFVDVRYADLMQDPVATVAAIHERIGRPWSDEDARRIRDYLAAKPKDKHGRHGYSASEWGVDVDGLRARLAPYMDRYRVPLET